MRIAAASTGVGATALATAFGASVRPWVVALLVAAAVAVLIAFLLAPLWTSREARAARLARGLVIAGIDRSDITKIIDTALLRPAGDEETGLFPAPTRGLERQARPARRGRRRTHQPQ